jgi:hypothetical protein
MLGFPTLWGDQLFAQRRELLGVESINLNHISIELETIGFQIQPSAWTAARKSIENERESSKICDLVFCFGDS